MNQHTAQRLVIPTEHRDSQLEITNFDRETAPTRGMFYTHRIVLEIGTNGHRSMISCKIAKARKFDLIIPFGWWNDKHPLKNIADPTKWVFEEAKCHKHIADEAVADLFEWDETVVYNEEEQLWEGLNEKKKGEYNWKPCKPYWQFKELFEEKKGKMLASRRTFDHAINRKEGA